MKEIFLVSFVGLLALFLLTSAQDEPTPKCGANAVLNYCVNSSQAYCNQEDLPVSYSPCRVGCQCFEGYVREAVDSPQCIPIEDCNKMRKCGKNKEYRICGTACPKYCGQPVDFQCIEQCVVGCQCKDGYVKRNQHSKDCIPVEECAKI